MRRLVRNIQALVVVSFKRIPNRKWCLQSRFVRQAILIEVGGVDNTEEELNRSIDALAKAFGEYFWQAEK